MKSMKIIQ